MLPDLKTEILIDGKWVPAMSLGAVRCGDTFRMIDFDGSVCTGLDKLENTTEFIALSDPKLMPNGKWGIKAGGRVHETIKN